MHYLKKEYKRLVKYAEGLGIKVTFSSSKHEYAAAMWIVDGSEIVVYNSKQMGPLQACLDLLHELSHHHTFVANGRRGDLKTDKILIKQDKNEVLTKEQRKVIYDMEVHDSKFQRVIHHEVNSKIPIKRLNLEIEYTHWIYRQFYLKATWPNKKQLQTKFKQLRGKHATH